MPTPSPSLPASTVVWPADWSQFLPDLIVAVVTGLAVGVAILVAERSMDHRRRARRIRVQQTAAVEAIRGTINSALDYSERTLLPADAGFAMIPAALAPVEDGRPDRLVPAFVFLREMLAAKRELERLATDARSWIERFGRDKQQRAELRSSVLTFKPSTRPQWLGSTRAGALEENEFWSLVKDHSAQRDVVDAIRRAFIQATWNADWAFSPVESVAVNQHGSPLIGDSPARKFYVPGARQRAAREADRVGWRMIALSDLPTQAVSLTARARRLGN